MANQKIIPGRSANVAVPVFVLAAGLAPGQERRDAPGTAEAEQVLRRFTRGGPKHPTYQAMLSLHLLQSALVHVNTLPMQQILADPKWADTLTDADRRALSPCADAREPLGIPSTATCSP
jgi:hypothetical protein